MEKGFLQRALYEILYQNVLLPRILEIDRKEDCEAFDGTTESLVQLHKANQLRCVARCSVYN